ncbi:MAG: hypothetical protein COB16_06635 [Rhodobacteraceae bacterium]|nr:MAG: hypothetical protein COB16_06635 [Paracoccaceae bacterium]
MVAPLLEGVQNWGLPADVDQRHGVPHFVERAEERGVVSVSGAQLYWYVSLALVRGRDDLVELVSPTRSGGVLYRIWLPEGLFYPVIREGRPVTIFDAEGKRRAQLGRRLPSAPRKWRSPAPAP